MRKDIRRRLNRLSRAGKETLRVVSIREGDQIPEAQPGELLVVIRKFTPKQECSA